MSLYYVIFSRLRDSLDSGDEILRDLMAKIEQAVEGHPGKDDSYKKPEASKVETIRVGGGIANAARG